MPPSFCICFSCSARSSRSNCALLHALAAIFSRLVGVDRLAPPSRPGHDVAHAEDAAGDALGVEGLEPVELFAGAEELDRHAGDGAHGQRRAAAAIAIDAGEDDAGERQALVEALGGSTASWPVSASATSRVSCGLAMSRDRGRLAHQRLVDVLRPGGIEDQHVEAAAAWPRPGRGGRCRRRLAGDDRQGVDADLLAQHRQLLHGGRTARCRARPSAPACLALLEPQRELGGGGGLARALQADHQDGHRRRRLRSGRRASCAQHLDQGVMDDLDHLLAGRDRADDLLADARLAAPWSMKSRTTGRATSASIRARRTSRIAASTSASDSAPRPVSRSKMPESRSCSVSNICPRLFRTPQTPLHPRANIAGGCRTPRLPVACAGTM